jgi:uncharacterized membrane protein YhiD involved in acid resistance
MNNTIWKIICAALVFCVLFLSINIFQKNAQISDLKTKNEKLISEKSDFEASLRLQSELINKQQLELKNAQKTLSAKQKEINSKYNSFTSANKTCEEQIAQIKRITEVFYAD